jgi:dTDP-4-dehydrorhamnose reductase
MRILITGAGGQLGNELRRLLTSGQAEIGPIPAVYTGAEVVYAGHKELDIIDALAVNSFISNGGFDLVINCAAMTNVDACETDHGGAFALNAQAPHNLACAVSMTSARLVQLSTDYVFSGTVATKRVESDPCDPQSVYGESKLAGEQAVLDECHRSFVVRTAWLYGYVGHNFVKTMLKVGRERGVAKVVDDQYGNPTNANDLAYEILKIAQTEDYGIYHCTNNGTVSWYGFTQSIYKDAGITVDLKPCTTDEFPRLARRPAFSSLDNAHLRATIGDEMRPWRDALATYLQNLDKLGEV